MDESRTLRYHRAGSHIVHDRFDGEVVILNLKSGCCFGLRKTAAEIWGYVDEGSDEVEILAALEAASSAPAGAKTRPPKKQPPFSTPRLVKYEDQKELLLLDPIHEVGDLGWPEKK